MSKTTHSGKLLYPDDVINPFVNNVAIHSTPLQRVKMILLGIILLPIRFILFLLFILVAWVFAKLVVLGYTDEERLKYPMREGFCKKATYFCARACMFFMGYQWLSINKDKYGLRPDGSKKRANVVVINHSTVCDGFLLYYLHGLMSIGVSDIADAPIFGAFAAAGQAFSLDRDNNKCRQNIGAELQRRAQWTDEQEKQYGRWNPFSVFAEGTCTNQKALIQFRHGAFLPAVAVQPLIVRYPFTYCDQAWCGLSSPLPTVIRLFCQFHNYLELEYLPVYEPSAEEKSDPYLYAHNVRAVMAKALNVPITDHSYEDLKVAAAATKVGLPWREIHAEMGYFRKHGSTCDRAKALLTQFAAADIDKDGYLSADELSQIMNFGNIRSDSFKGALLRAMTNDSRQGKVSFRHFYFVAGLRKISAHTEVPAAVKADDEDDEAVVTPSSKPSAEIFFFDVATEEQKQIAFNQLFSSFDQNRDGVISCEEFCDAMRSVLHALPNESDSTQTLRNIFGEIDSENRGSVSKHEFVNFLQHHKFLPELLLTWL